MGTIDTYVTAGTRENTQRSYRSAVEHFEVQWGGLLPASGDTIARYLAEHASTLSISTLQQRLAALASWHRDHGFADPTKAPLVRQVLKGIRSLHPSQQKQARPVQLEEVSQIVSWVDQMVSLAVDHNRHPDELRYTRDRALLLLGFWRGFRGDELTRLRVEHTKAVAGQGISCFLPRSKGDRNAQGVTFRTPALQRLCPVDAYLAWTKVSGIKEGPVFRGIDRWGNIRPEGLHINSLVPLLRSLFLAAGIAEADEYSGHSLRRGFASWATSNGWDLKTLMEYVGWRDVQSAIRYLETGERFGDLRK
ncbi:site-specific integrase [Massilia sp. BHUDP2]|uniref:site-specific integrase n=1 Tax=Massilia sp. BHUDP2 TaxID=3034505 RepID=UPI003905D71F